jgi:hypothetical protein
MALLLAAGLVGPRVGECDRMGKLTSPLLCAVLLGLTVVAMRPSAEAQAAIPTACDSGPVAQVFLPWADPAWYALVPDGGLERAGEGWVFARGAAVAGGNEPYSVRAPGDARSLALPDGASAATPPVCVGPGHPTLRFFMRNTGAAHGVLTVTLEFDDPLGVRRTVRVGAVGASAKWMPSPVLAMPTNVLSLISGRTVVLHFSADGGTWSIDDVYVDPYGKG